MYGLIKSPTGSPAVVSGLAMVTNAPISTFARHDLSPLHSLALETVMALLTNTPSVSCGGESDGTGAFSVFSIRFSGID
jgi:hypothetical protein